MILVIGTGVAGLSCALAAAECGAEVELVCDGAFGGWLGADGLVADAPGVHGLGGSAGTGERGGYAGLGFGTAGAAGVAAPAPGCNTALAQGGIAAVVGAGDTVASHVADTIAAGAGLVDAEASGALVRDGAALVRSLLDDGFAAGRDPEGGLRLGLEAAHSAARIVHAGGDRTGAALHAHLTARVLTAARAGRIVLRPHRTAVSLLEDAGAVAGAVLRDPSGALAVHRADAVVLATGGYAALYPRTSNHAGARGSGIVLAAQAGAAVADLEFVQFHPTVLHGTGSLVSEAVRGAGAVLRDGSGRRFMAELDPRAELAPRDVVSRETYRVLRERGEDCVWLDATGIETQEGRGALARRFPGISASVAALGLDWAREPIPVSPAAHYTMGGVVSDLDGRSTVPGLFVAGETAATGVHGANRLASNSLLEGLVFGDRAGRAAAAHAARPAEWRLRGTGARRLLAESERDAPASPAWAGAAAGPGADGSGIAAGPGIAACWGAAGPEGIGQDRSGSSVGEPAGGAALISRIVADGLGIERDAAGLRSASEDLARAVRSGDADPGEDAALASMMLRFAEARTESRGAHLRADRPNPDPGQGRRRALRFARQPAPSVVGRNTAELQRSLSSC